MLLVTAWLSSFTTSRLRAASRSCKILAALNIPGTTREWIYLESKDMPRGASCECEELPHANVLSPLRCFRLPMRQAGRLFNLSGYQGLARTLIRERYRRGRWRPPLQLRVSLSAEDGMDAVVPGAKISAETVRAALSAAEEVIRVARDELAGAERCPGREPCPQGTE